MRVLRAVFIATAVAAIVILAAASGPALAQRSGIYKNHYGVYTSPRQGSALPWQQPGVVTAQPRPATDTSRSSSSSSRSRLPWQPPATAAAPTGLVHVPTGLVPVPTGHTWSTYPYVYPYGWRWPVYVSPGWGGPMYGHVGGVRVAWGYGPQFGKGFIFSTRFGLAAYSSGRSGFSVRW
ncbi:MAG: hypothetical protein ISS74_04085 [Planctomycetes bacterium]|nr:hypothetical protein [Planctomycetota bacterium]